MSSPWLLSQMSLQIACIGLCSPAATKSPFVCFPVFSSSALEGTAYIRVQYCLASSTFLTHHQHQHQQCFKLLWLQRLPTGPCLEMPMPQQATTTIWWCSVASVCFARRELKACIWDFIGRCSVASVCFTRHNLKARVCGVTGQLAMGAAYGVAV